MGSRLEARPSRAPPAFWGKQEMALGPSIMVTTQPDFLRAQWSLIWVWVSALMEINYWLWANTLLKVSGNWSNLKETAHWILNILVASIVDIPNTKGKLSVKASMFGFHWWLIPFNFVVALWSWEGARRLGIERRVLISYPRHWGVGQQVLLVALSLGVACSNGQGRLQK